MLFKITYHKFITFLININKPTITNLPNIDLLTLIYY